VIAFHSESGNITIWPCFDNNNILLDHSANSTSPTNETYQSPSDFKHRFLLINRKKEKYLRDKFFTEDAIFTIGYTIQNGNVEPNKIRPERLGMRFMNDYHI
jgi:hypothetical protein